MHTRNWGPTKTRAHHPLKAKSKPPSLVSPLCNVEFLIELSALSLLGFPFLRLLHARLVILILRRITPQALVRSKEEEGEAIVH